MKLHLDFETRSAVDLQKVGAWAYAMHPSTEVLCMGWAARPDRLEGLSMRAIRDGWRIGVTGGPSKGNIIDTGFDGVISAHNAHFEYAIYNLILHRRHGWPPLWNPANWSCTLARAAMCGLPLGLDELGRVLNIKTPKDIDGRRIMMQLCKPTGVDALGEPVYDEDPKKLERLYQYNATDVVAEMEVDALLPELPPHERKIWEMDLIMNRRGIQVDTEFARRAAALSMAVVGPLNERLAVVTNGAVSKATQIPAFKRYLTTNGIEVPYTHVNGEKRERLDKIGITELLLRPDLPATVRQAVKIRRQVGKTTSTAKYSKALEMVCSDGRVRGTNQYHAAHTGRDGGRLLQLQNFPQGYREGEDGTTPDQDLMVSLVMTGDTEVFDFVYGENAMEALSDGLRAMIISAPGKSLIGADYNAIEARAVFWLADEEQALAAYRSGGSPYLDMSAYIFKRPISKKDVLEYKVGKATVLGAGFGMSWETWRDNIYAETAKKGDPLRLSDDLAKDSIRGYREKYARVPLMWKAVEAAAISAVRNPGRRYTCCGGRVLWSMSNDRRFLVAKLPSGRYLWYYKPEIKGAKTPWGEEKQTLFYWGQHPKTGEWCQLKTYGAATTENLVQAIARDIMFTGWHRVEAAGYPVVFKVHDEIVAERATGSGSLDEFIRLMCEPISWAPGFPLAAAGFVSTRYRK